MLDTLPKSGPWENESAVLNLGKSNTEGTHWVCYRKRGKMVLYFDSFGDLPPPDELVKYLQGCIIKYNYERRQNFNETNCGALCIKFLYNND